MTTEQNKGVVEGLESTNASEFNSSALLVRKKLKNG